MVKADGSWLRDSRFDTRESWKLFFICLMDVMITAPFVHMWNSVQLFPICWKLFPICLMGILIMISIEHMRNSFQLSRVSNLSNMTCLTLSRLQSLMVGRKTGILTSNTQCVKAILKKWSRSKNMNSPLNL